MIFRPLVIQYSNYLTEFKKSIKQYYGLTSLRNLLFIKPDRKLYYQDNQETEFCLSHPDWSEVQNPPATFPPETHTHDYAATSHTHPDGNADTLDGQHGSFYQNAGNLNAGTLPLARIPATLTGKDADTLDGQHGSFYQNAGNLNAGTIPLARIPATLTGKDADTLDGLHLNSIFGSMFAIKIATSYLGADGVVVFSGITQIYRHLLIYGQARTDRATGNDTVALRFNGDAGANYWNVYHHWYNGAAGGGAQTGQTLLNIAAIAGNADVWALVSGVGIFIPRYTDGYYKTAVVSVLGASYSSAQFLVQARGGGWFNTAAITSITLLPGVGTNFKVGTEFTLYGVNN